MVLFEFVGIVFLEVDCGMGGVFDFVDGVMSGFLHLIILKST